ncbi:transcriptional initiation protein Tat [Burkholderia multivorans]|uniref:transcriptional initiation protein Tat n=1 Tax=Burkholderia multivorans TaxID=87883 RepID=UPI0009B5D72E|nr:transcriptional initiation protein Tat [Burkholderia multivorans]MBU9471992.1 transcriptional initiation protein Tat [Burkholderia multivorans]
MAVQTDRRRLLKEASSLLALATLGGVASRDAQAPFYDARVVDLYGALRAGVLRRFASRLND